MTACYFPDRYTQHAEGASHRNLSDGTPPFEW
jgi:hypothetical protein